MKMSSIIVAIASLIASILPCASNPADEVMKQSVSLLAKNDWQSALNTLTPLLKKHADDGVQTFGAKFGVAYYYQGFCLLKLAQQARKSGDMPSATDLYEKSIHAFKQCHAIENTEQDISTQSINSYRIKALMLQANSEQAIGKFDLALQHYNQFLLKRNSAFDTYDIVDLNTNLAICYWSNSNTNDDLKGDEHILKAASLHQNDPGKYSTRSLLIGLKGLIDSSIQDKRHVKIENFMAANPYLLAIPISESIDTLPLLSSLTITAANAGLIQTTNTLNHAIPALPEEYTLIHPNNIESFEKIIELYPEITPRINGLSISKKALVQWRSITPEISKAVTNAITEANELAHCARIISLEANQALLTTLSGYEHLLNDPLYAQTQHKADHLYNAARLSIRSFKLNKAFQYAQPYIENYPEHQHRQSLQNHIIIALYYSELYAQCEMIAATAVKELSATEKTNPLYLDNALFALGGSLYYQSKFEKAAPLLNNHIESFPDSEHAKTANYLFASTLGKTRQWEESIRLLDQYIANQPDDDVYKPFAIYDKAYALYSMDKKDESAKTLSQFQGNYNHSIIKPSAHILLGNIRGLQRRRKEAITQYNAAINAASFVSNSHAKEEAYYLLISLLGQRTWDGLTNERLPEAVAQFDNFMQEKDALKSPFFTQIITASITALERAGRKEEAYNYLEEVLFLHNKQPNTPGIQAALKTYNIVKRRSGISDEEVIDSIINHKHLTGSPYHLAFIKIAAIDVLKRSQRLDPDKKRAKKINDLFLSLQVEFGPADLDNFALVELADHLTKQGGTNSQNAITYYQTVLDSTSKIKRPQAIVGIAKALAQSANPEQLATAKRKFLSIINDPYALPIPKAEAHYQLIEILYQQENYKELTNQIKRYIQYPSSAKKDIRRTEMLLAISYEQQEMTDKAISSYVAVMVNSFEKLDQSAPAVERLTDLIWKRNNPAKEGLQQGKSDKQIAYETAYKYIDRTKVHYEKHRNTLGDEGIEAWEKIKAKIKTFATDSSVTQLK